MAKSDLIIHKEGLKFTEQNVLDYLESKDLRADFAAFLMIQAVKNTDDE